MIVMMTRRVVLTNAAFVESAGNVESSSILFTTRERVGREVVALHENPGDRALGTILVELLSAGLGILEPILQAPSCCLFLWHRLSADA